MKILLQGDDIYTTWAIRSCCFAVRHQDFFKKIVLNKCDLDHVSQSFKKNDKMVVA